MHKLPNPDGKIIPLGLLTTIEKEKKKTQLSAKPYGGHTYMFSLGWIRGIFRTWKLFCSIWEEKDTMIYGSVLLSLRYITHATLPLPLLFISLSLSLLFILVGVVSCYLLHQIQVRHSKLHELYREFPNQNTRAATASENAYFLESSLVDFYGIPKLSFEVQLICRDLDLSRFLKIPKTIKMLLEKEILQ